MLLRTLFLLLFLANLAGCASSSSTASQEEEETANMSAQELYADARQKIKEADYEGAIRMLEILESRYPYGAYAEQAQLEIAYTYYKFDESESAILAAERFIKLHPNHKKVDYAYYLRGLASYDDKMGYIYRLFDQDITERDPKSVRRAFNFFAELVKRFPESQYTPDAIQRMYRIRDNLAQYELHVIDFYLRRKAYVAAVNRAKYVLENYQNTPAVADALGAMVTAYHKLGLHKLAADALKVLKLNYPKHKVTLQADRLLHDS